MDANQFSAGQSRCKKQKNIYIQILKTKSGSRRLSVCGSAKANHCEHQMEWERKSELFLESPESSNSTSIIIQMAHNWAINCALILVGLLFHSDTRHRHLSQRCILDCQLN